MAPRIVPALACLLACGWPALGAAADEDAPAPWIADAATYSVDVSADGPVLLDAEYTFRGLGDGGPATLAVLGPEAVVVDAPSASFASPAGLSVVLEGSGSRRVRVRAILPADRAGHARVAFAGGEIPLVEPRGVARATTFVGVDARSALELVAGSPRNAVPIDVRELPAALVGLTDYPVLLGFRARTGDVGIPLQVKAHPGIDMLLTLVDAAQAETLVTADGRRMTRVRYAVRNNRRQFLRLQLPEGAEVWSATVAGRSVKIARGEDGVLVPLVRSEAGGGALAAYAVELVYVEGGEALARGRGEIRAQLPTVDAPTSMLQWTVYVPASAKVLPGTSEGTVRRVPYYSSLPQLPAGAVVAAHVADAVGGEVQQQATGGVLGAGAEPVDVALPLGGTAMMFEKTLVLDEKLWVGFDYRNRERAL